MRVIGRTKPKGAMKVKGGRPGVLVAPAGALRGRSPTGRLRPVSRTKAGSSQRGCAG